MGSQAREVVAEDFYPRPPRGGRLPDGKGTTAGTVFLSTPSARRATLRVSAVFALVLVISIHALREEGDTPRECRFRPRTGHFYPRPPRGGRLGRSLGSGLCHGISIHALREEGDPNGLFFLATPCNFYPRPLRGGRLDEARVGKQPILISIHALCEEGDQEAGRYAPQTDYFYPRPPRGGRPISAAITAAIHAISIHALREEGDSKNGEKHLRFCFIIKRSAQIWKSFSKNIRKNSCDLHRTA